MGVTELRLIEKNGVEDSPARTREPAREPFRIGAVQQRWHPDPDEHRANLAAASVAIAIMIALLGLRMARSTVETLLDRAPEGASEKATARSSPFLRRSSASKRLSRERLPWWGSTIPSPSRDASAKATRSLIRRVLTKISVVRWDRTSSATRS